MPAGRPSSYTDAVAQEICTRLAHGESLRSIVRDDRMPTIDAVLYWLASPRHPEFVKQYAQAREAQADYLAAEIVQISDDGANDSYIDAQGNKRTDQDVVARSRLRVDARKWYASKLAPKKYGDRLELAGEVAVKRSAEMTDDELTAIATGRIQDSSAQKVPENTGQYNH